MKREEDSACYVRIFFSFLWKNGIFRYLIEKDGKGQGISIFTFGRNFPFVSFVSFVVLQDNILFTLNLH